MSIGFDGTGEAVLGNDPIETAHTITGDITVRLWCQFNNAPSVNEAIISTGEAGSTTESENALYSIRRSTAGYFQWRHENGAGINTTIVFDSANDYGVVPLGWEGYVCCVRDSVAKTVTLYVDGVRYSTRSYTNNPTGGTSGRLAFG